MKKIIPIHSEPKALKPHTTRTPNERERKVREAAVLRTSSNSIISAHKPGDQDCGEGSSRKRARSTGSGSEVSSPVINKKRKQIEVNVIEDDSDFDSIMQKRGPCENCIRKHLRCYLQPRSGRSSACAPCNKSKHGCSWVPKKQIQPKTERKPTVAADISQVLSDHLGTLISQSNFIIHLLKIIADNTTEDPGWKGDAQEGDILKDTSMDNC
ncbi:hypothetical protein F5890DRAFT_1560781 [Lentinula detonsa]|uniref:Zn(2)-C6 fungal-type domain-containing protein n=1 Tax=Lentinula detonsa TaxID=2804962 RepID=A0AA38PN75_9AGAR|nr:hypothetical protein F5890DRAFT_1560781 [Lentinula detonsa]